MPAFSLFASAVLRKVTSSANQADSDATHDGQAEETHPDFSTGPLVTWNELNDAYGSSLADLLAWLWSQSQYLSSVCQIWWQTPPRGWVKELNTADATLAANCAALSEDATLPSEVKMAAFEVVLSR